MRSGFVTLLCTTLIFVYTSMVTASVDFRFSLGVLDENRKAAFPFSPGFDIKKVALLAESLPSHSWEYGTAAEALLELYNPSISVFGDKPFPVPVYFRSEVKSLDYAASKIVLGDLLGTSPNALSDGAGAVGDPASLGVSAILLGKTEPQYALGAWSQQEYIVNRAPRWFNGAISQRADVAELWSDWMYMAPPFLAYYAVDCLDEDLLKEAVRQCGLQRQVLQANLSDSTSYKGVWHHIIGPQSYEPGLWSTGNAWSAGGMTRVLATIMKAPSELTNGWLDDAVSTLTFYIKEILDGAIGSPHDDCLLRNYLNDTTTAHGFGEISGTSLLAAVAYRMAVLQPSTFGEEYVLWADKVIETLAGDDAYGDPHVTANGTVTPAVNPLGWGDTKPWTAGSPEGQNFVLLMYVAWRDCIQAGVCARHGGLARSSAKFRF
ncbi:hypothetical protein Moror_10945 [Moniliophthora roreri MCA 2997]|uniref:Six-hairpin glycosidase n=1 Tax=Moniliophthora roreri (strain MCA 2997) TaxID=1381753 RepID=V2WIQ3_MONRO|nr:hypothetical protein Moror_10945 [Moniliophthora roreri MCA 2997]